MFKGTPPPITYVTYKLTREEYDDEYNPHVHCYRILLLLSQTSPTKNINITPTLSRNPITNDHHYDVITISKLIIN